jgi:hypothetical protein
MSTALKHWQDWTIVAIGVVVFATPFLFGETSNSSAAYTAYIMGLVLALAGFRAANAATPSRVGEWVGVVLGVFLFLTPWLFGFTAVTATSWVIWIAGVVVIAVSVIGLLGNKPQHAVTT